MASANCSVALAQLNRLTKGSDRIGADARDAVKWLDEITSVPSIENSGRVQLEGVDEAYVTWEEVEPFLLPETLLSMEDSDSEEDDTGYHEDLDSSFAHLDVSDETSISSSHSLDDPPKTPQSTVSTFSAANPGLGNGMPFDTRTPTMMTGSPARTARNSAEFPRVENSPQGAVPTFLKPLFNHILWRIHKESNPDAALESFILLTNDPTKQVIAQKFGIRAKRLEQLRDAVAREDREYRNHLLVRKMETSPSKPTTAPQWTSTEPKASRPKSHHSEEKFDSDDEDVVLLKRAPRGPQAHAAPNGQRLVDPNEFGRSIPQHPGGRGGRGRGRGGYGGNFGSPRGRGGPPHAPRGRGGFTPRGAYAPPGPAFRPPPAARAEPKPDEPIDPDSFARPTPRTNTMRGNRRKLWEPN